MKVLPLFLPEFFPLMPIFAVLSIKLKIEICEKINLPSVVLLAISSFCLFPI